MNSDYTVIKIPKGKGKFRTIHSPKPHLKKKQKDILQTLQGLRIHPGHHLHAYFKRRSVKTNAEALLVRDNGTLRSPDCILMLDIKDFFPSVTFGNLEESLNYERVPGWLIDEIYKNCFIIVKRETPYGTRNVSVLPQGAPTSPFLSSLMMKRVTAQIRGLIKKWNRENYCPAVFSAYCDNITVGSDDANIWKLIHPIDYILNENGLTLNWEKVKFHKQPASFVVCGVQMNSKIGPKRSYWRKLRADLHNALCDLRSGLAPAGFYLKCGPRKVIRMMSKIRGESGLVDKKDLDPWAMQHCTTGTKIIPVPFETWKGQISFIRSLDPSKADTLQKKFDELVRETCQRKQGSSSCSKTTTP
jgi:hypothetical protein